MSGTPKGGGKSSGQGGGGKAPKAKPKGGATNKGHSGQGKGLGKSGG